MGREAVERLFEKEQEIMMLNKQLDEYKTNEGRILTALENEKE